MSQKLHFYPVIIACGYVKESVYFLYIAGHILGFNQSGCTNSIQCYLG